MFSRLSSKLGALAFTTAVALTAMPTAGFAEATERSYNLTTRIVEQSPSVGEYDGHLQLRVSSDGTVSGYYRPDDNPRFIAVSGGITGDRFWLDIGSFARRPLRFSGTFNDGKIDAFGNNVILDNGRYTSLALTASPKVN